MGLLESLKIWLTIADNTPAKLAYKMGYRNSSTISNWVKRGEVPFNARKRLEEIIRGQQDD